MGRFVRPLVAALLAVAVLVSVLIGTSHSNGAAEALPSNTGTAQIDSDQIKAVANAGDCAEVVAILVPAFRSRGVAAKADKVGNTLGTIYSWWPGTFCGEWLAKNAVVPTICGLSSKPSWIPGRGTARWIVWFVSGGESTKCSN